MKYRRTNLKTGETKVLVFREYQGKAFASEAYKAEQFAQAKKLIAEWNLENNGWSYELVEEPQEETA